MAQDGNPWRRAGASEWFLTPDEERIIYLALTMAVMREDTLLQDEDLEDAEILRKEFKPE